MDNPLLRRLESFGELPDTDRHLLDSIVSRSRRVGAHEDLIREGDVPSDVRLIVEGFAFRYKITSEGNRQIVAYLVPGDLCNLHVFVLKAMDHSIATLLPSRIVDIPPSRILDISERPAIARALWWAALVDEAVSREWLVNMGRRNAEKRVAHLFCEMHLRLKAVGLAITANSSCLSRKRNSPTRWGSRTSMRTGCSRSCAASNSSPSGADTS